VILEVKLLVLVLAAVAGEAINELYFLPWMEAFKERMNEVVRVQLMRMWSGLVGILLALQLQLCIFSAVGVPMRQEWVGMVVTGLLIGRGSNYMHEFVKSWLIRE
jgi:hypothetical protein